MEKLGWGDTRTVSQEKRLAPKVFVYVAAGGRKIEPELIFPHALAYFQVPKIF